MDGFLPNDITKLLTKVDYIYYFSFAITVEISEFLCTHLGFGDGIAFCTFFSSIML